MYCYWNMILIFRKVGFEAVSNTVSRVLGVVLLLLCFASSARLSAAPTNIFVYHRADGSMDADIKSGDLLSLLQNISAATGWHVFLDPDARHAVSAKFKDLPSGQALHMLLGDVNFMGVPRTNGPSQLFVFRTAQRQATRRILTPPKPTKPIPRELVVTIKPGSKLKIEDLARSLNAKVIGRLNNSYLLQFADDASTQAAQAQLANNPDVSVDYNYPVDPPPPVQQAQSQSNPKLQLKPQTGNGNCQLVVGLIDTATPPPAAGISSVVMPPVSVVGNYTPDPSTLTHGTAMMDTIAQALAANSGGITSGAQGTVPSTSVKILPVDVYGANETTSTFNVAQG